MKEYKNAWSYFKGFHQKYFSLETFQGSFNYAVIKVVQLEYNNSTQVQTYDSEHNYKDYQLHMLYDVSKMLQFKFILVRPLDKEWGRYTNGKWTGKIGMVVYRKVAFALDVGITEERFKAIQPTAMVNTQSY